MQKFYFDLAKICFGVGFYGCITKIDDPAMILAIGVLSLLLAFVFAYVGINYKGE